MATGRTTKTGARGARASRPIVALLTDFGTEGWYVGVMKGVIKKVCPAADIIDISHQVAPHSIVEAGIMLAASYRYFPDNTIFVAVIDPGVGTAREPVVVKTNRQYFIAPNNGLLSVVVQQTQRFDCRKLSNAEYFLPSPSNTFHGRDIFAPAAGHLAAGVPLASIAPKKTELFGLATTTASYDAGIIEGNIIYFDHFGNAMTNISHDLYMDCFRTRGVAGKPPAAGRQAKVAMPQRRGRTPIAVHVGNWVLPGISDTYASVNIGDAVAYWGSTGMLEIGINHGNARARLKLKLLDKISIRLHGKDVS